MSERRLPMTKTINITERKYHESCLGRVLQLKIFTDDFDRLYWSEVWEEFVKRYPGKWAVQVFPPVEKLVDGKNVYHLWVLDQCPEGLSLR